MTTPPVPPEAAAPALRDHWRAEEREEIARLADDLNALYEQRDGRITKGWLPFGYRLRYGGVPVTRPVLIAAAWTLAGLLVLAAAVVLGAVFGSGAWGGS